MNISNRPATLSRSLSVSLPHQTLASPRTCFHLPANRSLFINPPLDYLKELCLFARDFESLIPSRSSRPNVGGDRSQTFRHPLGRFTFADERIGTGGDGRLLTGIHMADENNDQSSRTGPA